ncbi:MAG: hypothetical protein ACK5WS_01765 [Alphaproteobacteria bacterium]
MKENNEFYNINPSVCSDTDVDNQYYYITEEKVFLELDQDEKLIQQYEELSLNITNVFLDLLSWLFI